MQKREEWVDLTKGLLIAMVVLGHVMKGIIHAGLSGETLSRDFMNLHYALVTFRMPLFFLLSGYLTTRGTALPTLTDYKAQFFKRLIRLGIPYVCFSLLEGVLRIVLDGHTNRPTAWSELLLIPVKPIDHFWFIYALIALFTLLPLLEMALKNERLVFATLFVLYFGLALVNLESVPFLNFAITNALFFYAGIFFKRHMPAFFDNPSWLLLGGIPYVVYKIMVYGHDYSALGPPTFSSLFSLLLLAISGSMLCIYVCCFLLGKVPNIRTVLSKLGIYSYEIYILHVIALAAVRIVLMKLQVGHPMVHLVLGELAGVLIPMVLGLYIARLPVLHFMLYPNRFLEKRTVKVLHESPQSPLPQQAVSIAS